MSKFVSPRTTFNSTRIGSSKNLPYVLIIPIAILTAFLVVYPISQGIYISLTDKTLGAAVDQKVSFVGLANYINLIQNSAFLASIRITVSYATLNVIFSSSLQVQPETADCEPKTVTPCHTYSVSSSGMSMVSPSLLAT